MLCFMRTTLTLADDVADRLLELQKKQGLTLKEAVNQTSRAGLERQMAHHAPNAQSSRSGRARWAFGQA